MTVEVAIANRLVADAGVAALVGTRVYQQKLPQKAILPAIRVQLIDEPKEYHLRGEQGSTRARVQIDAFEAELNVADPKGSVDAVAAAVHAALSGQRFTGGTPAEIEILTAFRDARRPMYDADELRLLRVAQDFIVWSRSV